jgi:hypothetical protein
MVEIDPQKRLEAIDRFVSLAGLSGAAAESLVADGEATNCRHPDFGRIPKR